jgi:mannose-6-phosphate isomerase-like protein (cupin superfamily)
MTTFELERTYLSLDQAQVTPLPVGPDFWETIETNPNVRGRLATVMAGEGDWPSWEVHPRGDEVLVLLEGELEMVLERNGEETRHPMRPGATLVVPAGTWHRAVAQRRVKMLFLTWGEGTDHRPASA